MVGTNVELDRHELGDVARTAADALAWRIRPVGTAVDGDIVFAVSPGGVASRDPLQIELMAQDALAMAVERAVVTARGVEGVPGLDDGR